jgi:hypothetical protein
MCRLSLESIGNRSWMNYQESRFRLLEILFPNLDADFGGKSSKMFEGICPSWPCVIHNEINDWNSILKRFITYGVHVSKFKD